MGYWSEKFHAMPAVMNSSEVVINPENGLTLKLLLQQMKAADAPKEFGNAIECAVVKLLERRQRHGAVAVDEIAALFLAFEACLALPKDVAKLETRKDIRVAVDAIDHAAIRMAAEEQARYR